jgi:hypothetical protein
MAACRALLLETKLDALKKPLPARIVLVKDTSTVDQALKVCGSRPAGLPAAGRRASRWRAVVARGAPSRHPGCPRRAGAVAPQDPVRAGARGVG